MVSHPVDIHVGKRLRLRRNVLGMSQEELGISVGVSFQQVQKYEKGSNRIGSSRLYDISKVLSAPIEYFFEQFSPEEGSVIGGLEESSEQSSDSMFRNKETITLVKYYYRIQDPDVRNKILSLVKTLQGDL